MRIGRLALIAVCAALAGCSAAAQTTVSPLSGSDEIRASRPLGEVEALVFDLRREVTAKGKPTKVTEEVVTLAPTFSLSAQGDGQTLQDHLLCRTATWKPGANSFEGASCYAAVGFRVFEIQNRQMLGRALGAVDFDAAQFSYLSEAELGMLTAAPAQLASRKTAAGTEYMLGKVPVARVSGSAGEATADEMKRLTRFLAGHERLHPQIRRDIAAGARLPALIEAEVGSMRVGDERQVLQIANVRRARVAYPLPGGLDSALAVEARTEKTPRAAALARAQAVLAGKAPRPTVESLLAAMRKATNNGDGLQAMLLVVELTQEHFGALKPGGAANATVSELRPAIWRSAGPDLDQFMAANKLAGDPNAAGDREAAARFLASHRMDGMAFGTFRYVTYANLVGVSKGSATWDPAIKAAMPAVLQDNYWIHIAAHPWSANAYKDVGDSYLQGYATGEAWDAFDLGRAVDPNWRDGPMAAMARFEEELRTRQPDFF